MKKIRKYIFGSLIAIGLILVFHSQLFAADTSGTELNHAYQFAFENWLITQTNIQQADMYWFLIRSDMAKILVNYDMKILGQAPDTWLVCEFADVSNETSETKNYATLACQLGIMWVHADGTPAEIFNPHEIVTRATWGTALSRLLYGNLFNWWTPYYINHLNALKNAAIISNTIPDVKEIKWYALLMLMRAEKDK